MAGKNTAVFGIYPSSSAVTEAVEHLRSQGFRGTDTSVLVPENLGTKDFAHEKSTKAPEGCTIGSVAGGILGGTLGWLLSIGAISIPQLAPMAATAPVIAALAGVGAGGILGGLLGALAGSGVPEYEAVRFEGRIREGGILVSVHCDDRIWVRRAKDAMLHTGAQSVAAAPERHGDFANADKPMPRVGTGTNVLDEIANPHVHDGTV